MYTEGALPQKMHFFKELHIYVFHSVQAQNWYIQRCVMVVLCKMDYFLSQVS